MPVNLRNVRIIYPQLFEAKAYLKEGVPTGKPRYGATLLLPKGSESLKLVLANINEVCKVALKDDWEMKKAEFAAHPGKWPLKDGDLGNKFPGHYLLAAYRYEKSGPPTVVDKNPRVALSEKDGRIYAGCYVNSSVEFYIQKGSTPGVRCGLAGVQFRDDGPSLAGGRPASIEDFEDLSDADASTADALAEFM